jgi:hypothetical protein
LLDREHLPCATHSRLHFVHDQLNSVLRRNCPQSLEETVGCDDVPALALNGLDDDGGDFVGATRGGTNSCCSMNSMQRSAVASGKSPERYVSGYGA